jgi:hypothetical protein
MVFIDPGGPLMTKCPHYGAHERRVYATFNGYGDITARSNRYDHEVIDEAAFRTY